MFKEPEPNVTRLKIAREAVQSYIVKKKRSTTALLVATLVAEASFLGLLLVCMDFHSRLDWFLLYGFLLIYAPLILFSWHNSEKIDHVYYRLLEELKYGHRDDP
ncbi:hypothetical protein ACFL5O_04730 [Myxococcota bacterium]